MRKLDDVDEEYRKNKELKKEDVQLLKEWIEKQQHLPKISEFQIIIFLHSCYYRMEPTKICIETFYTARVHCPEFFKNRNPIEIEPQLFESFAVVPLRKPTPLGYQIIYVKLINTDPSRVNLGNTYKAFDMVAMLMLHQQGTAPGYIILADIAGLVFGHLARLTPSTIMKFLYYLQEALPFRLKGLIYINIPTFMDKIVAILKPIMKKELLEAFQLYTDKLDDLYKTIPLECLPMDYGGQDDSIDKLIEKTKENLLANKDFFIEDEKQKADESKRVGKSKYAEDVFGIDGTFKKLDID
ncbi:hypothetical protein Trydic_g23178 [Trypoxylus dichotomus]